MVNSLVITVITPGGFERNVWVTGMWDNPNGYGFVNAPKYRVQLPDENDNEENYHSLGEIHFSKDWQDWVYIGDGLSIPEQEEIAEICQTYQDGDWIEEK